MTLCIDLPVLRALIGDTAAEIKTIKRVLRAPWDRPMAVEQKHLAALKRKATGLCILRALLRGKHHLQRPPRGFTGEWLAESYHRQVAEQTADRYRLVRNEGMK